MPTKQRAACAANAACSPAASMRRPVIAGAITRHAEPAASRRPSTSPRRDGAAAFVASEAGSVRSSPTATVPRIRHAVDGRAFFWFL